MGKGLWEREAGKVRKPRLGSTSLRSSNEPQGLHPVDRNQLDFLGINGSIPLEKAKRGGQGMLTGIRKVWQFKSWLRLRANLEDSEESRKIRDWMSSPRGENTLNALVDKGSVTMDDVIAMRDEILAANDERKQIHA
jgi:hypothetical protein